MGSFRANVLTLMTGTTVAQAIPIAISPILTRLYTPDDLGIFALYMSIPSLISIIATGRYELAIMLPQKDEEAINIVALSILIALSISMVTLVCIWLFNDQLIKLLNYKEISQWVYFIPVTVLLTGLYNTFSYWSNRKKQYSRLAVSRIVQSTTTAGANLGFGFSGFSNIGLLYGNIIGQAISTSILGMRVWQEKGDTLHVVAKKEMLRQARMYKDFPKINSLHAFTDMLQSSGIIMLIAYFFGNTILGFYSFALRIVKTPMALIGSSVGQVFYQRASHLYNTGGDLKTLTERMMIKLFLIGFLPFLALFLYAPELCSFVFGGNWREAGLYIQILSPWLMLNFLISPISQLPLIFNEQKTSFFISSVENISIFGSLIVGYIVFREVYPALIAMSVVSSIVLSIYGFWIYLIASKQRKAEIE